MERDRAQRFDVIVLGAGAAGMMAAAECGKRGRSVLIVDHAKAPGEKIRISGGGRCNFTNLRASPANFLSENPRFCVSALKRYSAADFIRLVERHRIAYHEKTLGQLFCDGSAREIIELLLSEMRETGALLRLSTGVERVEKTADGFDVTLTDADGARRASCASLIVATGGKSIPKMGATGLGYEIAQQFGLDIVETRPGLVPLTFAEQVLAPMKALAGVSVEAEVGCGKTRFREAMLFTHRGLSGPAILQISSFWREGDEIAIDMTPDEDLFLALREARTQSGRQAPQTALAAHLPKRLADHVIAEADLPPRLADCSDKRLRALEAGIRDWRVKPVGSEGYRTAEVTLGGVDTRGLDSKTMQAKAVPGLYFIGEVVDVTGWLGGYNFQWAWSSGWAAGQAA